MKKIFNQKVWICALAVIILSSCHDQLDLAPLSEIGENGYYNDADEVEAGVIAIYDGLQNVPLREFALTEMRSDNTQSKSFEGDWAQFEAYEVQPTNTAIQQYWSDNYNVIFRANRVLDNLDVVTVPSQRARLEGEARFARALAHFNLVRAFGPVPMIDKVVIPADEDAFAGVDVNTTLAFIEGDFASAAGSLPPTQSSYGRATSGAANALLAKVRLRQGNYTGADAAINAVVNSAEYSLMSDYNDVFYNEGNSEMIFTIPYLNDDANESQDFSFEMTAGGVVSGLNYVTADFTASLDPDDAIRVLTHYNPGNAREVGKFLTSSADARLCGNDWIVIRYADVLLMKAEAAMAGGTSTQNVPGIEAYNEVRTRAGMTTLATDGSATLTRDMLLDERRTELAFENHRLYDLVRFGVAQDVLTTYAGTIGRVFSPTDIILPIPQNEINVSNGKLLQNPGY